MKFYTIELKENINKQFKSGSDRYLLLFVGFFIVKNYFVWVLFFENNYLNIASDVTDQSASVKNILLMGIGDDIDIIGGKSSEKSPSLTNCRCEMMCQLRKKIFLNNNTSTYSFELIEFRNKLRRDRSFRIIFCIS